MASETINTTTTIATPTLDADLEAVFNGQTPQTQTLLFLNQILRNQIKMTTQIDTLTAEVAQDVTVMNAASSALDACQAALTAAQTALAAAPTLSASDQQALTDATNKLETARTSLAAAVAKDTPAAPTAPASGGTGAGTATATATNTPAPSPSPAPTTPAAA